MIVRYRYILFALYLLLVGYIVFIEGEARGLLTLELRDIHLSLIPLCTTQFTFQQLINKSFVHQHVLLYNLIGNIVLFMPFGFILRYKDSRFTSLFIIAMACVFSCTIEVFQYIFICGITDIDDVLLNTLGAYLGCVIAARVSSY